MADLPGTGLVCFLEMFGAYSNLLDVHTWWYHVVPVNVTTTTDLFGGGWGTTHRCFALNIPNPIDRNVRHYSS